MLKYLQQYSLIHFNDVWDGTQEHENSVLFDVNIMVICPLSLIAITRKLRVKWNKNYSGLQKLISHVLKAPHMPIRECKCILPFWCGSFTDLPFVLCFAARGCDRGHEKRKDHRVSCLLHNLKQRWPTFCFSLALEQYFYKKKKQFYAQNQGHQMPSSIQSLAWNIPTIKWMETHLCGIEV